MILPDVNLLLYAKDASSTPHARARKWLERTLSSAQPVGFCWPVLSGFIRIATHHKLHKRPLSLADATETVDEWLRQPCSRVIGPTNRHWEEFQRQLIFVHASGNLVSDATLAALSVEHQATIYSSDSDFSLFPHIRWVNPLD